MYKQLIIARRDLRMSPGKLAAQAAHASMAFLVDKVVKNTTYRDRNENRFLASYDGIAPIDYRREDLRQWAKEAVERHEKYFYAEPVNPADPYEDLKLIEKVKTHYFTSFVINDDLYEQWINGSFTKVVCVARNKSHLIKAVKMAEELGLRESKDFYLIRDNCSTELEPEDEDGRTLTCIGFTPMEDTIIDKIGKKYQLY